MKTSKYISPTIELLIIASEQFILTGSGNDGLNVYPGDWETGGEFGGEAC